MGPGARTILVIILAGGCATSAHPNAAVVATQHSPDAAVVKALHDTYCFKPHELTREQQEARGKDLDALWEATAKDPARYLPAIRAELAGDRQVPFFYFDGGRLLLKLSSAPSDRALALAALARVDLQDIEPLDFVEAVNRFARDGLDTTAAAFTILADPKFVAIVPAHATELHQSDALRFMLLPSGHAAIAPAVVARYAVEKTEAAKQALLVLAFDLAPEGDPLVRRVAADGQEIPAVRAHAQATLKLMSQIAAARSPGQLMAVVTGKRAPATRRATEMPPGFPKTVAEVLAARRQAAGRISDEALDEIEMDSMLLRMYLARDAAKPH
jgi:hypothetical protein